METLINNLMVDIVSNLVSNLVLFLLWLVSVSYILYTVYKTRMYGLLVIAVGIAPTVFFRLTRMSKSPLVVTPYDIFHNGVAEIALAISILLSVRLMYREWVVRKTWKK